VIVAADGIKALSLFAGQMKEIDAVITDLMMPLMDGITLIRTVRKMKPQIMIIASTGHSDDQRMRELRTLNVPLCLMKPYHRRTLLDAVHETLAQQPKCPPFLPGTLFN
jgi:CheY-like chemotaxis protein